MKAQESKINECGYSDSRTLNAEQLEALAQTALLAAKTAGLMIAEQRGQKLSIEHKDNAASLASAVFTEVDLMAEKIILETLQPSCEKYDLALLTEESPDDGSRFKKDYFWCIDPLDGSLPFISGSAGFSVSIALVSQQGEAIIGVVYDPVEEILYHAIKGQGAFRNQEPWPLLQSSKSFTLYNDRSFKDFIHFEGICQNIKELSENLGFTEFKRSFEAGGVMNAIKVLENPSACYFKLPRKGESGGSIWDYAASVCIFNEMGAVVTDFTGHELDLNRKASTKLNHKGVIYSNNKLLKNVVLKDLESFYSS